MPSNSSPTLGDLLQHAKAGSADSADALYQRCQPPLLALIRKLLRKPVRRLCDSADILQTTFAEIFEKNFTETVLNSPAKLWSYFKKIATNNVRDLHRKYLDRERRNLHMDVSLETAAIKEVVASTDISPEDAVLLKEIFEVHLEWYLENVERQPLVYRHVLKLMIRGHDIRSMSAVINRKPEEVLRSVGNAEKSMKMDDHAAPRKTDSVGSSDMK